MVCIVVSALSHFIIQLCLHRVLCVCHRDPEPLQVQVWLQTATVRKYNDTTSYWSAVNTVF